MRFDGRTKPGLNEHDDRLAQASESLTSIDFKLEAFNLLRSRMGPLGVLEGPLHAVAYFSFAASSFALSRKMLVGNNFC